MTGDLRRAALPPFLLIAFAGSGGAPPKYDLLLRGGHVIDPRNGTSAVPDVPIAEGRSAAVAPRSDPAEAGKTVDVSGLYVTPGLVDIHVHVFTGTGEKGSYAGDNSVYPDGFTLRVGVTTVADAGCAGWRNFEDFKTRVIDRAKTRVLAFLNIIGRGMRGGAFEQDLADMEARPTAEAALRHPGLIVGVKTGHYAGAECAPVESAVEAGDPAGVPPGEAGAPVGGRARRPRGAAPGDGPLRVRGLVRRALAGDEKARLRDDAARRQGGLRPQRHGPSGLACLASGLQVDGRPPLGRDLEVKMARSNRRGFLAKAPVVAVAAATASTASAADEAASKPVKRVHWSGGKRPEKPPLFSPVVSYGGLVFISGIGAHLEGDIKAHTKHVLDEIQKKLEEDDSSMEKARKGNCDLNEVQ